MAMNEAIDKLADDLARNIINQLGDFWYERIPSEKWVPVRQATNDELDKWVSGLLAGFARAATKTALEEVTEAEANAWDEGYNAGSGGEYHSLGANPYIREEMK